MCSSDLVTAIRGGEQDDFLANARESDLVVLLDSLTQRLARLQSEQADLVTARQDVLSGSDAEALARTNFPDGSIMLAKLHVEGKLTKVATDEVEMLPNFQTKIIFFHIFSISFYSFLINYYNISHNPSINLLFQKKKVPSAGLEPATFRYQLTSFHPRHLATSRSDFIYSRTLYH